MPRTRARVFRPRPRTLDLSALISACLGMLLASVLQGCPSALYTTHCNRPRWRPHGRDDSRFGDQMETEWLDRRSSVGKLLVVQGLMVGEWRAPHLSPGWGVERRG